MDVRQTGRQDFRRRATDALMVAVPCSAVVIDQSHSQSADAQIRGVEPQQPPPGGTSGGTRATSSVGASMNS